MIVESKENSFKFLYNYQEFLKLDQIIPKESLVENEDFKKLFDSLSDLNYNIKK